MKRIFYLFAAFVSSATALSAATDDIYSQCISAKFDSPADAQKSAAEILPYPDGRKIAFSTRWDDTNPRHLATAQMLSKRGMFATCYLVGYGFQNPETLAMVRGVLELGGAIGSHTLTHPHLENFIPNEFFGEIALELLLGRGCTRIDIYGAGGGREDHLFGNLQLLLAGFRRGAFTVMHTNYVDAYCARGQVCWRGLRGRTLSLAPAGERAHIIESEGLKYPLCDLTLRAGSCRGISNVVEADSARIFCDAGTLFVFEVREEAKW